MDLVDRLRRTIRRHRLAGPQTGVVVGLSGGSDSVALTHLLSALDASGELRLVGLAHFNHQLRLAADADERFCAQVASRLHLPFVAGRGDVRERARSERRSIEEAARMARHAFLEEARAQLNADVIALGHTRDDQAETLLLRLLRGAGAKGLAGMHPRHGAVIRPLLDTRRGDLCAYLEGRGVAYVTDESNADVSIPRNRVRAELIPLLERRFNPSIVDVLAGEAAIARDEYWYLAELADAWIARSVSREPGRIALDGTALADVPVAVARTVLHRLMTEMAGNRAVGFDDVERALEVSAGARGGFDAPGQRVERIAAGVVLTSSTTGSVGETAGRSPRSNKFDYSLSIPGEVGVPEVGATLSAEVLSSWDQRVSGGTAQVAVQLDSGLRRLGVRNRRDGDRFQPLGMRGRKKLQDFFVDRKVARERRDTVPIVVDEADRIVWVAGHAIDESFRVKDPAQSVIILRLKGVGGSA